MLWALLAVNLYAQTKKGGLSPDKHLTQFVLDGWDEKTGLPFNNLSDIQQASDGYLWISSFEGLIRFDGKTFEVFNQASSEEFKANGVYQSKEGPDGKIWIATQGSGLLYYWQGKIHRAKGQGDFSKPVSAILPASNGDVWLGTINSGLYLYAGDTLVAMEHPYVTGAAIRYMVEDTKRQSIWIGTEGNGVVSLKDKTVWRQYTDKQGLPSNRVPAIGIDAQGKVWAGAYSGIAVLEGENFIAIPHTDNIQVNKIFTDAYGSTWAASSRGVVRVNGQSHEIEILGQENGLPVPFVSSMVYDKEFNLWICTRGGGLLRLQDGKFLNFTQLDGLHGKAIHSMFEIAPNEVLVSSSSNKLNLIKDNKVYDWPIGYEMPDTDIRGIWLDSKKRLWLATYSGLLMKDGDKHLFFNSKNGLASNSVRRVFENSRGEVWIALRNGGIAKYTEDGNWRDYTVEDGLGSNFAMCFAEDAQGRLVIGTNGGGLNLMDSTGNVEVIDNEQGLLGTIVFNVYCDKEGRLWVATNAGICLVEGGKVKAFQPVDGLPNAAPFDIVADGQGHLWMPSNQGVFKVSKSSMISYERGKSSLLQAIGYNKEDGMKTSECSGPESALITEDGRVFFPTINGVAIIDPDNIPQNLMAPEVRMNSLIVDGKATDIYVDDIVLPAGTGRLVFNYAGLSFVSPPEVRFKYKLIPLDTDWQDGGKINQTVYTNLPHGTYAFQVIARNNDGVWSSEGASLSFRIEAYWYDTLLAKGLGALLLIGLFGLFYRWRLKQVEARADELEAEVQQRTYELQQQKEEVMSQRDLLEQSYDNIKIVSDIGQEVTSLLDTNMLVPSVYKHINQLMSADGFGIGLYNSMHHSIDFSGYIENGETLEFIREPIHEGNYLSGYCYTKQSPIILNNVREDYQYYFPELKITAGEIPQSVMYWPLWGGTHERLIGVLAVQSFKMGAYGSQQQTILGALASYIAIALQNMRSFGQLKNQNEQITDSIRYAQTIQEALLPSLKQLDARGLPFTLLYRPKDIVSGDFYWTGTHGDTTYLAVVDCTGHGVPGAFMSMLGTEYLNKILITDGILQPAKMLEQLNSYVVTGLRQDENKNHDGMDMAICAITPKGSQVEVVFSGAKLPLFYTLNGEVQIIKGARVHIGGGTDYTRSKADFEQHTLLLNKGEKIYMYSDGLVDQSSPKGKKFGLKKFVELVQEVQGLNIQEQGNKIAEALDNHQQDIPQRDDITLIGVEL